MTTRTNQRRFFFLETSGVIYRQHGHSLQKAAVRDAVGDGVVEVSNFIRMEYLRGFVINLIEFYFLVKESDSVADALIDWSQKVKQERKLKVLLIFLPTWLYGQENWQDRENSLRRLGELIVRMVFEFDDRFKSRMEDRLRCQLGRITFPHRTFNEDMLLQFYEDFRGVQESVPACRLCVFKKKQQRSLAKKGIDLHSAAQRETHKKYKGYVAQAERLEEAAETQDTLPKCRWCERLGDSIIVLQTRPRAIIVTADRAFVPFCQILKREIRLLPSLVELKRQLEEQKTADDGR